MKDVFGKYIKPVIQILRDTHLVTSLGVRMRNPIQEKGVWSGWSPEEVAEHLKMVEKYKLAQPKEKKPNGRGC